MRKSLFIIVAALIACTIPTPESSASAESQAVTIKPDTVNEFKHLVDKAGEYNDLLNQLKDAK